ncbi:MAG: hypothetical protein R3Y63_15705 [Eubacteriales bacterium]
MLLTENTENLVSNAQGQSYVLVMDKKYYIPVFVGESAPKNTYLVSLFSHYILYAKEELGELNNKTMECFGNIALSLVGFLLKPCRIDDVVYVNQLLVSTNLYPDFPFHEEVNHFLAKKFPKKVICWNSINEKTTPTLYQEMKRTEMLFLPSRSVFYYTEFPNKLSRDLKRDIAFRSKSNLLIKKLETNNFDGDRVKQLYDMLYLDKYSKFNPNYTKSYFESTLSTGFIEYYGLFDGEEMVGVVGFFTVENTSATPVVGVDSSRSIKEGIYRLLVLKAYDEARNNDRIFHCSAGAGSFKRNRQAKNVFEYRVLHFSKTTTVGQRTALKLIAWIFEKIVIPMMKKKGL